MAGAKRLLDERTGNAYDRIASSKDRMLFTIARCSVYSAVWCSVAHKHNAMLFCSGYCANHPPVSGTAKVRLERAITRRVWAEWACADNNEVVDGYCDGCCAILNALVATLDTKSAFPWVDDKTAGHFCRTSTTCCSWTSNTTSTRPHQTSFSRWKMWDITNSSPMPWCRKCHDLWLLPATSSRGARRWLNHQPELVESPLMLVTLW